MTTQIGLQCTAALVRARTRLLAPWLLGSASRRVLLIAGVVAAFGVPEILGLGSEIAEAGLPPRSPTGPGPE